MGPEPGAATVVQAAEALERAIDVVRERRDVDLAGFRRSTLQRRLANRMSAMRTLDPQVYLGTLTSDDAEVDHLVAAFTIKVSYFWRNPLTFERLRHDVLPRLAARSGGRPLHLWSAGCGNGEEAYSLATLLDHVAGEVVATDIDSMALARARRGRYAAAAVAAVPSDLAARHLVAADGESVEVAPELRERVRFLRHDLASGTPPPGAPFDLVSCRNVLIYFQPQLQARVLRLLADTLAPGGVLCLGEAEWEGPLTGELRAVDRGLRLFERRTA